MLWGTGYPTFLSFAPGRVWSRLLPRLETRMAGKKAEGGDEEDEDGKV
jgi:hypothetical protein